MSKLNHDLKMLCRRNKDGSYTTQANRARMLDQAANQLKALGYRQLRATSLKSKHIDALIQHWKKEGLSAGTLKNRLSTLRWWAEKIDRPALLARDNAFYGIEQRQFVSNHSKACQLDQTRLEKIADQHIKFSLELQREFGLRREEAIKFKPSYADRGDSIVLKSSWTKGGRSREIPITQASQRDLLNRITQTVGNASLIPSNRNFIQQLRIYEKQTAKAGFSKLHGLRHAYAQSRYEHLTGRKSPAAGGPTTKQLSQSQKDQDRWARQLITEELGHGRSEITAIYLGR